MYLSPQINYADANFKQCALQLVELVQIAPMSVTDCTNTIETEAIFKYSFGTCDLCGCSKTRTLSGNTCSMATLLYWGKPFRHVFLVIMSI